MSKESEIILRCELSKESTDEIVRYLYRLIDEIQFQKYSEYPCGENKKINPSLGDESQNKSSDDFNDPIPF
jgi:hypothetical protein